MAFNPVDKIVKVYIDTQRYGEDLGLLHVDLQQVYWWRGRGGT